MRAAAREPSTTRAAGTLTEEGEHRMGGVAEQGDRVTAPGVNRRPVEELVPKQGLRPRRGEQARNRLGPGAVAGEQPGDPVLAGVPRELGAVGGVPVDRPSGERCHAEDLPATPVLAGGKLAAPIVDNGAVADHPACARWTVAEQGGSGHRVDAVGANDDLRVEPLSHGQPDKRRRRRRPSASA